MDISIATYFILEMCLQFHIHFVGLSPITFLKWLQQSLWIAAETTFAQETMPDPKFVQFS